MNRRAGVRVFLLLWLGACGGGSPAKGPTPPDDTGGEGGGASTGGSGGQMTKPDAAAKPDVATSEPDTGMTATGGATGGAEAGVPTPDTAVEPDLGGGSAGEFPLAAVKAGKAALFGRVGTQTEGPSYRGGSVYFASDGNGLVRVDDTGKVFKYHPKLNPVGTYLLADGSMLVCEKAYTVVQVFKDGSVGSLFSAADHAKVDFCNDLTIDAKGDVYFTNPHNDTVWRLSVDGALDRVAALANGAFPNGLEVDRAGTSLYLSASGALWKIDLPASGNTFPAPQKVGPGGADGMAFDDWDHLWLSIYSSGQLVVWDPATKQTIASISAGSASSTNVCFGDGAVYTTIFQKGVYKIPIAGIRGFLHKGADKYTIKQMLNLTPVNDPL